VKNCQNWPKLVKNCPQTKTNAPKCDKN
jgi:hypothetical protein